MGEIVAAPTRTHTRTRTNTHTCTHAHAHTHTHKYTHIHTCTHTRTYTHKHTTLVVIVPQLTTHIEIMMMLKTCQLKDKDYKENGPLIRKTNLMISYCCSTCTTLTTILQKSFFKDQHSLHIILLLASYVM